MLWLSPSMVRIGQKWCGTGYVNLSVSWSLRRLAGWFGGMSTDCIRVLVVGLLRRWLMML